MGSKNIILMMFYVSLSPLFIGASLAMEPSHDPRSLDEILHEHAQKVLKRPRTGKFYNITTPSNYSGMEISFIRLRSKSLWVGGNNCSFIHIPERIVPFPFARRVDIIYQNLGNWSSYYYNVPNHTFVAPIIGFTTYDSTKNSSVTQSPMLGLRVWGDPILVRFPMISPKGGENATMKCVRFGANGKVKFGNVTMPNLCKAWGQGHFSIVVPALRPEWSKDGDKAWKWWLIWFGVGIGGLALVGILVCKLVRKKKIESMERQSEKSEALHTVWVGRSKMPSASGIRTQPVLENDYLP